MTIVTMSDAKKDSTSTETPVVIAQMNSPEPKRSKTKKYLIIGGSIILGMAIILTAILVGMYLFTKAQTDLIKYTMNIDKDTKQDMTTDKDENTIEYYNQNQDREVWVYDDFNRDIQTMKVKDASGTVCYLLPLNRTSRTLPSDVLPDSQNKKGNYTEKLSYKIGDTSVAERSFLGKKARDACSGLSVYWLYPTCDGGDHSGAQRQKRACYNCYYRYSYYCYGCCVCDYYDCYYC